MTGADVDAPAAQAEAAAQAVGPEAALSPGGPAEAAAEGAEVAAAGERRADAIPLGEDGELDEAALGQAVGVDLVTRLLALTGAVQIYDLNNEAVLRLVDAVVETVARYQAAGGGALELTLLGEALCIGGRLVRMDNQLYTRATKLAGLLSRFELRALTFEEGCDRETLLPFIQDLAASQREGVSRLRFDAYPGLALGRGGGELVASVSFEAQQLAATLYASLTELTRALYAEHAAGRSPALGPLKRTLERVLEDMAERAGVYRALSAVSAAVVGGPDRLRVAIAIDSMGLGLFLGLPPADAAVLGLAGILAGLSDSEDPVEAVAPTLRFGGLGEASVPLVLAIHDACAARQGKAAGVAGRLLTVVETYHQLTSPNGHGPPTAPHSALARMCAGELAGVDVGPARFFADYYGIYPIGSTVRLSDGRAALVIAHGEGEGGKMRPRLALLDADGEPGERVDLASIPALSIVGIPRDALPPAPAEAPADGALPGGAEPEAVAAAAGPLPAAGAPSGGDFAGEEGGEAAADAGAAADQAAPDAQAEEAAPSAEAAPPPEGAAVAGEDDPWDDLAGVFDVLVEGVEELEASGAGTDPPGPSAAPEEPPPPEDGGDSAAPEGEIPLLDAAALLPLDGAVAGPLETPTDPAPLGPEVAANQRARGEDAPPGPPPEAVRAAPEVSTTPSQEPPASPPDAVAWEDLDAVFAGLDEEPVAAPLAAPSAAADGDASAVEVAPPTARPAAPGGQVSSATVAPAPAPPAASEAEERTHAAATPPALDPAPPEAERAPTGKAEAAAPDAATAGAAQPVSRARRALVAAQRAAALAESSRQRAEARAQEAAALIGQARAAMDEAADARAAVQGGGASAEAQARASAAAERARALKLTAAEAAHEASALRAEAAEKASMAAKLKAVAQAMARADGGGAG